MSEAIDFLNLLFADTQDHFLIWTLPDGMSYWFTDPGNAATRVEALVAEKRDVYVGCGLSPRAMGSKNRCPAAEISGIVGVWADVDVADAVHTKKNLPPDDESALALINGMGLAPSAIVSSGHGFHAWWLFKEPWVFDGGEDREKAQSLVASWGYTLMSRAKEKGWTIDSAFDLARILRVPGTMNRKVASDIKPVTILSQSDARYDPEDFVDYMIDSVVVSDPHFTVAVGKLKLDPNAEPPSQKFELLLDNIDNFRPVWNFKRKDLNGDASAYDLALCNIAVDCGWEDQEIANLLIAFWRKNNLRMKTREDYVQRTIAKARIDYEKRINGLNVDNGMTTIAAKRTELKEAPHGEREDRKEVLLKMLSEKLGIPIVKFVKYTCEPAKYALVTTLGTVQLGGIGNISNQQRFRDEVASAIDRFPERIRKEWDVIQGALMDCVEHEDLGEEATEQGETKGWIAAYLDEKRLAESIRESNPYKDENGIVYIHLKDMTAWLERRKSGQNVKSADLSRRIQIVGAKPVVRGGSRVWSLEKVELHTI